MQAFSRASRRLCNIGTTMVIGDTMPSLCSSFNHVPLIPSSTSLVALKQQQLHTAANQLLTDGRLAFYILQFCLYSHVQHSFSCNAAPGVVDRAVVHPPATGPTLFHRNAAPFSPVNAFSVHPSLMSLATAPSALLFNKLCGRSGDLVHVAAQEEEVETVSSVEWRADSVRRKRKRKMNKHKHAKRRKLNRHKR